MEILSGFFWGLMEGKFFRKCVGIALSSALYVSLYQSAFGYAVNIDLLLWKMIPNFYDLGYVSYSLLISYLIMIYFIISSIIIYWHFWLTLVVAYSIFTIGILLSSANSIFWVLITVVPILVVVVAFLGLMILAQSILQKEKIEIALREKE